MTDLTNNEIDEVMSEIGMRIANDIVDRPLDDDQIDDDLVTALGEAKKSQLYEVVDNMIDFLSVAEILNQALSDDNKIDKEEIDELMEYVTEIEMDTKALIKDLIITH
ncbi:hypothetical protein MNBD_GAMMA03-807 [hydrothermal vent metagenome]|uniref:Uncharacterized protein n=1 Tax=hydrothermal vent metagenome TaxID=652676 RepID=A0A3B0VYN8_9ZZZZ